MDDITMCSQKLCPNAAHCYRSMCWTPRYWQAFAAFEYTVTPDGVLCDAYWPMAVRSATSASTQDK